MWNTLVRASNLGGVWLERPDPGRCCNPTIPIVILVIITNLHAITSKETAQRCSRPENTWPQSNRTVFSPSLRKAAREGPFGSFNSLGLLDNLFEEDGPATVMLRRWASQTSRTVGSLSAAERKDLQPVMVEVETKSYLKYNGTLPASHYCA